ncbi:MAG: hypothetical protein KF690_06890 [Bacteroidetes bacterium]|nr:hypothetical protein [Bacteroidota bacterium]
MMADWQKITGISDAAVEKNTGSTWAQWIAFLNDLGAEVLTHKEIVTVLTREVDNIWWCQEIALGYQRCIGKRVLGQTADAGFQIGVTRTLPVDKDKLWDILVSDAGLEIWLGKFTSSPANNDVYQTEDNIRGEVRVFKPGSHIRMTWQPAHWEQPSILQVRTTARGDKAILAFHQEKLPSAEERERMKSFWMNKIEEVIQLVKRSGAWRGA